MTDQLLTFPPDISDVGDYDEVLQALVRLTGLDAYVSARRSDDGWTITVEHEGHLRRARHVEDGTVSLSTVVPLLNQALDRGPLAARLYGYVEADWGSETGAILANSGELAAWKNSGQVTAYEDSSLAEASDRAAGSAAELDGLIDRGGARMPVRDGERPPPADPGESDLDRLIDG